MHPPHRSALLVIDVQNDFCPGGALPVPEGDRIIDSLNRAVAHAVAKGLLVYASRDQHPTHTVHFDLYGGPWPVHCVAGTPGAEFHPGLVLPADVRLVDKGQAPAADGYSAFEGQTAEGIPFGRELETRGVQHLVVGGLATDYCVKQSVLDAKRIGLGVTLLTDAVAGVEREKGDTERALEEMRAAGAEMLTSEEFCQELGARS